MIHNHSKSPRTIGEVLDFILQESGAVVKDQDQLIQYIWAPDTLFRGLEEYGNDILLQAVITGKLPAPVMTASYSRSPKGPESLALIAKALSARGKPLCRDFDSKGHEGIPTLFGFVEGFADLSQIRRDELCLTFYLASPKLAAELTALFFEHTKETAKDKLGQVYILQEQHGNISFQQMGYGASPLIRENYNESVLTDYDHVVSDLQDSNPCGQLVLLSGEPGTGKTHLTRALLGSIEKAIFVLVPSQAMKTLSDPKIIPAFLGLKNSDARPIVLMVEDADETLSKRKAENMSAISTLLNLSDGIMGSILNLRVITTTNSASVEIEPALIRARRLCRHIHVKRLHVGRAQEAYRRLCGKEMRFTSEPTLAEVYDLANPKS